MCKATLKKSYNYGPYLRRFVEGELFGRFVPTRRRPNRRFGYLYPGKKIETKAKIGVLADTSGSMSDEDMSLIARNLENIGQHAQVILFDVDTCIHDVREYSKRSFDNILKGGGGTRFSDVFKIIGNPKKHKHLLDGVPVKNRLRARQLIRDIKALIIITDGEAWGIPEQPPKIPVLWALTRRCYRKPVKWGSVIYLDNNPENHQH